jgi:hypothetical protein
MRFDDVIQFPRSPADDSTEHVSAVARRDAAIDEEARAGAVYRESVGTQNELAASNVLAGARDQVAARQAWVNWIEGDHR